MASQELLREGSGAPDARKQTPSSCPSHPCPVRPTQADESKIEFKSLKPEKGHSPESLATGNGCQIGDT